MAWTRLKFLAVAGTAVALVGSSALVSYATPSGRPSDALPDKNSEASPHGEDLPPTPLQAEAATKKRAAAAKVASGDVAASSDSVKLDDGEYAQWGTNESDHILTFLVDFGDKTSEHGGEPGPAVNKIPEPDRDWDGDATDDNSTAWTKDFDREYYQEMLFGDDGTSMTDFYEKQSGGAYTVDGTVEDWVTVPYNEARYGANGNEDEGYPAFVADSAQAWYDSQIAAGKTPGEIASYLEQFDVWDRYDHDGDGEFQEPDGYIDHFQAIHAGIGEEAGGGAQGEDAIWSHRWFADTGQAGPDDNPQGGAKIGDTNLWIGDYTTEPENGGLGVFTHEFGHDLGLPDLYATEGDDNSTGRWTLMSGGSWLNTGKDNIGDLPGYMGPWEKFYLGWLDYDRVALDEDKTRAKLGAAAEPGRHSAATLVELPDVKETREYPAPVSGKHEWMAGDGDDLNSTLARSLDLSDAKDEVSIDTKAYIDTEKDYDFFFAEVSTDDGATWQELGDKHDGDSGKFVDVSYDLSEYAGKQVEFRYRYTSDANTHGQGVFLDDVSLNIDGSAAWSDDVESGEGDWTALGWTITTGTEEYAHPQFYLAENRRHVSYDDALRTGPYSFGWGEKRPDWVERYPYQEGMLVWYVNTSYADNNTGTHPGAGLALPVDARSTPLAYQDGSLLSPTHQTFDATFGKRSTDELTLHKDGEATSFPAQDAVRVFDDSDPNAYWSKKLPNSSVKVAGEGVKIKVNRDGGDTKPMMITVTRS